MSKRPAIDLAALTAEAAAPMTEASQRAAPRHAGRQRRQRRCAAGRGRQRKPPIFRRWRSRCSPGFRKRFRQRAADADLKLNELLFEALDAWEEKRGLKR